MCQLNPPPYLYATYGNVDELSTPRDKVFFFSNVRIGHGFHELQDRGLGFTEEGSHYVETFDGRVVMCNEAATQ
jgi:hypothetical protein